MRVYTDKLKTIAISSDTNQNISNLKKILRSINNYDFNACMIDDFKQYRKALENNKLIAMGLKNQGITSVTYFDTRILELN